MPHVFLHIQILGPDLSRLLLARNRDSMAKVKKSKIQHGASDIFFIIQFKIKENYATVFFPALSSWLIIGPVTFADL